MSIISNSVSQPKQDIFDLSICCMSELPKIKKEAVDTVLTKVPQFACEHRLWSHSRIGRELASIAYKQFEQIMRSKFSAPGYNYFLKCSIEQQYPYFHTDLALLITKTLKQAAIPAGSQPAQSEPVEPTSSVDSKGIPNS